MRTSVHTPPRHGVRQRFVRYLHSLSLLKNLLGGRSAVIPMDGTVEARPFDQRESASGALSRETGEIPRFILLVMRLKSGVIFRIYLLKSLLYYYIARNAYI